MFGNSETGREFRSRDLEYYSRNIVVVILDFESGTLGLDFECG